MDTEDLTRLPPGFRFHPNDEELIVHYLLNKVNRRSIPASVIKEIELYKFDPWDLPRKAGFGVDEWYFFSPRDRKYPNGSRPKRSAGTGFWKATGKDKPIFASSGSRKIGVKKPLAFFSGSPTKSVKTNWTMSEYRLPESSTQSSKLKGSMRLDDWVLCRVRQKGNMAKNKSEVEENPKNNHISTTTAHELPSSYMATKADVDVISDRRFTEFQLMALILAGQDLPPMITAGSPKLLQDTKTNDNAGLIYENEENVPFMFNGEAFKYKDVYSSDTLAPEDLFGVIDPNHLDVMMKLIK